MILVADGGSTKIDWGMVDGEGTISHFKTTGVNPYFYQADKVYEILAPELQGNAFNDRVTDIFFYGAGCSSPLRNSRIEEALQRLFPNASILVDHDLLGAAKALCGKEAGIATILGTGSNSCLFNGEEIASQSGGIGYILGDEGSGAYLGKRLIRDIFYKEAPEEIEKAFYQTYQTTKDEIIDNIYRQPEPNQYLGSFAPFLSDHYQNEYIQRIIYQAFQDFCQHHVVRYHNYTAYPVHSVGSIGYHFQNLLHKVLRENDAQPGIILTRPIDQLTLFHKKEKHLT